MPQAITNKLPAQTWLTDPAGNRLADRAGRADNPRRRQPLPPLSLRPPAPAGALHPQPAGQHPDPHPIPVRPLGRRTGKVVRETPRHGSPERVTRAWYGWDGDHLTTTQTDTARIQTVYLPGSFTPLVRIETATAELQKATRRSLAEKLQQDGGVTFPPELVTLLDRLEGELRSGHLSEQSQQWLAQCGLTAERMQNQLEPVHTPQRTIHLYHCDHRGLPLALISADGKTVWSAEYDVWGGCAQ